MPDGDILLPTAYFPPIPYYIRLARGKCVSIEQMETFPKQTYRNRCEIAAVSGKMSLVIPVSRPYGNHTRTGDIEISYREKWPMRHWRAIQAAYGASPFFSYYADILYGTFLSSETSLIRRNQHNLQVVNTLLGIHPEIKLTGSFVKDPQGTDDLRKAFSPKRTGPFKANFRYPQVFEHWHGFIPGLSILDLLFNLGPDSLAYLREQPV